MVQNAEPPVVGRPKADVFAQNVEPLEVERLEAEPAQNEVRGGHQFFGEFQLAPGTRETDGLSWVAGIAGPSAKQGKDVGPENDA